MVENKSRVDAQERGVATRSNGCGAVRKDQGAGLIPVVDDDYGIQAIEEGLKTEYVSKQQILDTLRGQDGSSI